LKTVRLGRADGSSRTGIKPHLARLGASMFESCPSTSLRAGWAHQSHFRRSTRSAVDSMRTATCQLESSGVPSSCRSGCCRRLRSATRAIVAFKPPGAVSVNKNLGWSSVFGAAPPAPCFSHE
jgi:hypothetical protein